MTKFMKSLLTMALLLLPFVGKAALGEGRLMFPENPLMITEPGHVVVMWSTDIVSTTGNPTVKLNAPGVTNATVSAIVEPNDDDNGLSEGSATYIFPTLEFDLNNYVNKTTPNYGEWVITIPAGIVCATSNPSDVNTEQTIKLYWYKDNEEFEIDPVFGGVNDSPAYNAGILSSVKITWEGCTSIERNLNVKGAYVEGRPQGQTTKEFEIDDKISIQGNALVLDLSSIPVGTYRLVIPIGYVFLKTNDGKTFVNYTIANYNNWFTVTDGMAQGIPQEPFTPLKDGYPFVSSSVKYMDVLWPGSNLSFTGTGSIKIYPDEWKDFEPVVIPTSNISLVSLDGTNDVLRIEYGDVELNENFWSPMRVLEIPEGYLKDATGALNPLQNIIFNVLVEIDSAPTWTPADGSVVNPNEEKISLSWNGAAWVSYSGDIPAYLEDAQGNQTYLKLYDENFSPNGQIVIGGDNNALVTFDFTKMNLAMGTYKIVVPAGAFSMETEIANPVNGAMEYTFTYTDGSIPVVQYLGQPSTISPRNGSTLPSLSLAYLYWNNVEWEIPVERGNPYQLDSSVLSKLHIVANGKEIDNMSGARILAINTKQSNEVTETGGPAELYIQFPDVTFFLTGTVDITIDEGLINDVNGKYTPKVSFSYNVEKFADAQPASDPASVDLENPEAYVPLGELDKVVITWENQKVSAISSSASFILITATMVEDDVVETRTRLTPSITEEGGLLFQLGEYTKESGTYVLEIGEYSVNFDNGMTNGPAQFTYIVSTDTDGITHVYGNDKEGFIVFDMNGVLLLKSSNPSDLKCLKKGIYVINGKKVILKK